MTTTDVAKETGLPINLAKLAKNREYDEVFKIASGDETSVAQAIEAQGLKYTKGNRYNHLMGNNDKGKATKTLTSIYQKESQKVITIGIGDSPNDQPMLTHVDKPFLIEGNKLPFWKEILNLAQTYTANV